MTTECNQFVFGFHPEKRREIRTQFDGGAISSDGGGLLLREVEKRIGILIVTVRTPDELCFRFSFLKVADFKGIFTG